MRDIKKDSPNLRESLESLIYQLSEIPLQQSGRALPCCASLRAIHTVLSWSFASRDQNSISKFTEMILRLLFSVNDPNVDQGLKKNHPIPLTDKAIIHLTQQSGRQGACGRAGIYFSFRTVMVS